MKRRLFALVDVDWPGLLVLVLPLAVALYGVAATWGSKANTPPSAIDLNYRTMELVRTS